MPRYAPEDESAQWNITGCNMILLENIGHKDKRQNRQIRQVSRRTFISREYLLSVICEQDHIERGSPHHEAHDFMAASTSTRTRSFGGCGKCRARHMKCDEQRPQCSNCVAYYLDCDGYTRNIFFDSNEESGVIRYRQLLFTDREREQMNDLMTSQVPLHRTSHAINAIEVACEGDPETSNIQKGPFGVFRLNQNPPRIPSPSLSTLLRLASPVPSDLNLFELPDWMETSSIFDFEGGIGSEAMREPSPAISDTFDQWLVLANVDTPLILSLDDAPLLLKHYAENVVASLTPFRHAKTPWHVLFLPNAKTTLAGLAMAETIDSANMTSFYGVLAISALDLDSSSAGSRWQIEASNLERKAQVCFVDVLQRALDRPKVFKYKSIVMAILVMVQLSMINGSWEQTDTYLLEAERIVRLLGLTKKDKSRKVRLLHHCYAYTRIFHESLSLLPTRSPNRLMIRDAIERSGVIVPSQDPLSFRLAAWENLEKQSSEAKNREQGENDLHLGTPGVWTATLYPEIFGVPEIWLMLLSQVIRLANEKELAENSEVIDAMSLKDYMKRAKDLENCILRWESSAAAAAIWNLSNEPAKTNVDLIILESMLGALRYALAIYFYRRIFDVDPDILQPKVIKVKEFLMACKELGQCNKHLNSLIWPAFIAGCEAIDPDLQETFLEWFRMGIQRNVPASLVRMKSTMEQVWEERRNQHGISVSWLRLSTGGLRIS